MDQTEFEFRAGLRDEDDAPLLAAPDVPGYREHIWWIAHDSSNGMGVMFHMGTAEHDFNVIRQQVVVFLPNDELIIDICHAEAIRTPWRVRGASLIMQCVHPFHQWRMTTNSMGQRAMLRELWSNALRPGAKIPLRLDIDAECVGPVWSADGKQGAERMQQQEWASSHYQQTIRLRGTVIIDGVSHDFDGTGVRDHSRGPRHMGKWTGHCLSSAPFPGGRSFGIMAMAGHGGTILYSSAYVVCDGKMERGHPRPLPPLSAALLGKETVTIEIELENRVEVITAHTHARGLVTMLVPYEVVPGLARDQPASIAVCEALATFVWDGETGSGILERSLLTELL
jgi:hypothetical protein